jgi:lipoprotein NlpD
MAAGCASGSLYTPETYIVKPRDTLYSIAWRHDLDYRELARWNHIGTDYRIAVGQVLVLKPGNYRAPPVAARADAVPSTAAPSAAAPRASAPSASAPSANVPSTRESFRTGAASLGQPCNAASSGMPEPPQAPHWMWPTAHASEPRPVPGGGILLLGALGQPIRAACGGRVVYVGNGIRGYGNLIIIKHGDTVLSAYAHTVELTVREGQEVQAGEQIARMGTGAHDIAALYFEIRLNGKPVDPLSFLPSDGG